MTSGWQTKRLGEVCSFLNRGISPTYLEAGGICVLNQKCIRDHRISYEPSRRHDAEAKKVGSDRLVQAGDVLVNSTGTGTLGRVAQLCEDPSEPTTVDSHVTIVRPRRGEFYLDFSKKPSRKLVRAVVAKRNWRDLSWPKSSPCSTPNLSTNSSGSLAFSTKRLMASPPPKPTPKRTSNTPAHCSPATSNPSSPGQGRSGCRNHSRAWSPQVPFS